MKKIGILAMVLVLALAAVGVGYAAWTDNLQINGEAQTGNIDVNYTYADNGVVSTDGDSITWNLGSDLVPGQVVTLEYDITNSGSVSATVTEDVTIETNCSVVVDVSVEGTLGAGATATGKLTLTVSGSVDELQPVVVQIAHHAGL